MKKILGVLILFALMFSIVGCGSNVVKVDLNKTEKHSFGDLSFELPDVYERQKESSEYLDFYDLKELDGKIYDIFTCDFEVERSKLYDFDDTLENEYKDSISPDYFDDDYKINTTTINNVTWTYVTANSKKDEDGSYYRKVSYGADYKGYRYKVDFTEYLAEDNKCEALIKKVTGSLKFE